MKRTIVFRCVLFGLFAVACGLAGCGTQSSPRVGGGPPAALKSAPPPMMPGDELLIISRVPTTEDRSLELQGAFDRSGDAISRFRRAEDDAAHALSLTKADDAYVDPPGCGTLYCRLPDAEAASKQVPLPLDHTDVDAAIDGYIASVTVSQVYRNPYDTKIEAVYVFPLPQNGAVTDFIMTIGERRIRGIVRPREQAEAIYREARSQGHVASLMTQERPNIFTQKVANIEPGKRIDVEMTYFNTLAYSDGWYEFVFPMVVGPRYNPPDSTDGVGAVARGATGASGQATEVSYLSPAERSGHDIALDLSIHAGVPLEEITCSSHVVTTSRLGSSEVHVSLGKADTIPNKDFVLRYRVAGDEPRASVIATRDARGDGYFTMMVYPPFALDQSKRGPIEMVFVVDCSGSMRGEPIAKAKRAIERALGQMGPSDTFQVIRFSNNASTLGPRPLTATPANIRKGLRFVRSLQADGGTRMIRGLRASLNFPNDGERPRYVTFLTDGYIGNEAEILGTIEQRLGDARIFSFGIGSSPNRYLMERMARMGRGVVAYVGLNDNPTSVIDDFMNRIRSAPMSNVRIDFGSMDVSDVYPSRLPDLLVGRPIVVTGRYQGSGQAQVRISGQSGSEQLEIPMTVDLDVVTDDDRALRRVWARTQIAELADRQTWDHDPELPQRIKQLALDHGLMSAYTAFVAVDSSRRTDGDHGVTVPVAVPVPDGVSYDTTVASGG